MDVKTLINRAVRQYPDNTALIFGADRFTFQQLNERANRLARGLLDLGLKKGDRVGMLMNNCPEFIEIDFALAKTGLVRVPLNARLTGSDHEYILNDSQARALIFGSEHAEVLVGVKDRLPSVEQFIQISRAPRLSEPAASCDYEQIQHSYSCEEPDCPVTEDDLHTLFYTSGTTGKPKGVMLTQKSWAAVVVNLVTDYGPIDEDDVLLNTQLLSHGAGFFVLPFFIRGATNVLLPRFSPDLVYETIARERVTVLKLVPVMLYQLLDWPQKQHHDVSSLKTIIYGGSPAAAPRLIEAIRFFGPKLIQLYGQAETPMCITYLAKRGHVVDGPAEAVRRLNSAGRPCTNVDVRVVDAEGKEVQAETVGEVTVRGDHMFGGYWNKPEETAETLKGGWVYTGDLGFFDHRGFLFLVDRKKDMIISGGFNIYPKEIEDVIVNHPEVQEVAVIGVPDEKWGEAVKAVVVPKTGAALSEAQIIEFCRNHLAGFKKPKTVDFVSRLPRNPYGKVLKTVLREPYWQATSRRIH